MNWWDTLWKSALVPVVEGPYAVGAALNDLTSGHSTTFDAAQALGLYGNVPAPQISDFVGGASFVGPPGAPNEGQLQLPFANPTGAKLPGDIAESVVNYVVNPIAKPLLKNLEPWLIAGAAVAAVVLLKD